MQNLRRLTPREIQELQHQQGFTLIDVREPSEFAAGHLAGSLPIPLGELPQRLTEIPADSVPIFICRSGGRSLQACLFSLQNGLPAAINLEGGLQAWARDLDPDLSVL
jgi:rhodanese-related sulfurtransferase